MKEHQSPKTRRDSVPISFITKANSKSLNTRKTRSDLPQVKMSTKWDRHERTEQEFPHPSLSYFCVWSDTWRVFFPGDFYFRSLLASGRQVQVKGRCLFSLFQKAPLTAQIALAACRNFGMSFALSLFWREGRLLSGLFHSSARSLWPVSMYHIEDAVKKCPLPSKYIHYV